MSEQSEDETARPRPSGKPVAGAEGARKAAVRVVDGAVKQFLDGVRGALVDLPPGEVDEILDDVRAHLADLADELGERPDRDALTARLGTPAAYAAELRAAAGYPPPPPPPAAGEAPSRVVPRLALGGLVASAVLIPVGLLDRSPTTMALGVAATLLALPALTREGPRMTAVAELPELRGLLAQLPRARDGFLGDLQAAWWVLRALIAAVLFLVLFGYPELLVVVLLTALAAPVSVWLGRRSKRDRRWLWLVVPLNALAVAVLGLLGPGWATSPQVATVQADYYPYPSGLAQDGEPIRDIRPVDANGDPLTGVYLFDQDGRPITVDDYACEGYYDGGGPTGPVQSYPRGTWDNDPDTGQCILVPPGPLVVAVPSVTTTATAGAVPPTDPVPTTEPVPPTEPVPTTVPVVVPSTVAPAPAQPTG